MVALPTAPVEPARICELSGFAKPRRDRTGRDFELSGEMETLTVHQGDSITWCGWLERSACLAAIQVPRAWHVSGIVDLVTLGVTGTAPNGR